MSDDTSQSAASLAQLIAREIQYVSELIDILRAENDTLNHNDRDGLITVIADKQGVIEALNEVDRRRAHCLNGAGYAADRHGVEAYIRDQAQPARGKLERLWQQLIELASACQRQNLVNGSIIGMSLRHCTQAVAVLCGQDPRQELYDPRGNALAAPRHRLPVKA